MQRYVDRMGVIEVRTVDDQDNVIWDESVDLFLFQDEIDHIPDNFCAKHRYSGLQRIFHCLVCVVDMKSAQSLHLHASGQKHARKVIGTATKNMNSEQQETKAKVQPIKKRESNSSELKMPLIERLKQDEFQPALGLEYVSEYSSPSQSREHAMYTCSLPGCKSAWGDSNDMYNHLCGKNMKHNRNYLINVLQMESAHGMARNALLQAAQECQESGRRDYSLMRRVKDDAKYKELRRRPADWSEMKAKLGVKVGGNVGGSNALPLGSRRKRAAAADEDCLNQTDSGYDTKEHVDEISLKRKYVPPTNQELADKMMETLSRLEAQILDNLDDLYRDAVDPESDEARRSRLKAVTSEALRQFNFCLDTFEKCPNRRLVEKRFRVMREDAALTEIKYERAMARRDEVLKAMRERLADARQKVKSFVGGRAEIQYDALAGRLDELRTELNRFRPETEQQGQERDGLQDECLAAKSELDARSDDLSALLERKFDVASAADALRREKEEKKRKVERAAEAAAAERAADEARKLAAAEEKRAAEAAEAERAAKESREKAAAAERRAKEAQELTADAEAEARARFQRDITAHLLCELKPYLAYKHESSGGSDRSQSKLRDLADLEQNAFHIRDKVTSAELALFRTTGMAWEKFCVTTETKRNVSKYVVKAMDKKPPIFL